MAYIEVTQRANRSSSTFDYTEHSYQLVVEDGDLGSEIEDAKKELAELEREESIRVEELEGDRNQMFWNAQGIV